MLTPTSRDEQIELFQKRVRGLTNRFNLVKQFRGFGSKSNIHKLYETNCEETKIFLDVNVHDFFEANKPKVVEIQIQSQQKAQIPPQYRPLFDCSRLCRNDTEE
jgi:hypothetical protein